MLRFILIMIGLAISAFSMAMMIRYGLKLAISLDDRFCDRRDAGFRGFRRHFRFPTAVGVIPEFFYFMVLGGNNYFTARWWALRTASYLSFLVFLAALFSRRAVESYYSLSFLQEQGIAALFTSGSSFWYLNMVNALFIGLFIMICIESIRMHGWLSPVRIVLYTSLSLLMASLSLSILTLIIAVSLLYVAYKIIKWFMTSSRRVKVENHDDDDTREKFNNTYRMFRADLYEWERDRKTERKASREVKKKPVIRRKRKKIVRKPVEKSNDFPRIYPD